MFNLKELIKNFDEKGLVITAKKDNEFGVWDGFVRSKRNPEFESSVFGDTQQVALLKACIVAFIELENQRTPAKPM